MRADAAARNRMGSAGFATRSAGKRTGSARGAAGGRGEVAATPQPLSPLQEWVWTLQRAYPESTLFHLPCAVRIRGPLRERRLERVLARLIERHAALRTTFAGAGEQVAAVVHESVALTVPVVATEREPRPGAALAKLDYQSLEEVRRPFDLATEPPLRARLFHLDPNDHVLLVTFHQLVADAWSAEILLRDLEQLYHGLTAREPVSLSKLPRQPPDVAAWQRRWLASERGAEDLAYWTRRLRDLDLVRLPADRQARAERSTRGGRVQRQVPAVLRDRLAGQARRDETTLETWLLTALTVLLAGETGRDDVAVGLRVPGRIRPGSEELVGQFANTLMVGAELSGQPSFREGARRVDQGMAAAMPHQLVPFPRILAELHPEQPPGLDQWCPVTFAMFADQGSTAPRAAGDVTFERIAAPLAETAAELAVTISDEADGLLVTFDYAADLFTEEAISGLLDRFVGLLVRVAVEPELRPWPGTDPTGRATSVPQPDVAPSARPAVRPLRPALVPLLSGPGRRPLYAVPGGSGSAGMLVATASQLRRLALARPVYGFLATEPAAADDGHAWVEATAAAHVRELLTIQPDDPHLLLGTGVGGILAMAMAMAMASQLAESGFPPPHVILLDTPHPALGIASPGAVWRDLTVPPAAPRRRALQIGNPAAPVLTGDEAEAGDDPSRYFERVLHGPRIVPLMAYRPRPYPGEVTLLANQDWLDLAPGLGWEPPAVARLHVHALPGDHEGVTEDNSALIGAILRPLLDAIEATAKTGSPAAVRA